MPATLPSNAWSPYAASGSTTAPATSEVRFLTGNAVAQAALSISLVRRPPLANPTFPVSGQFIADAANCTGCATYMSCQGDFASCGGPGTRYFRAVAGSWEFTRADTNPNTGFIRGSIVTPTRFIEWDFQTNAAIGAGDCFELSPTTFEGQWP